MSTGELKHIQKLKTWPLESVLVDKYCLENEDAQMLTSFLEPMLNVTPEKRATALDMLSHTWLEGVTVMGELEAKILAEADEDTLKERLEAGRTAAIRISDDAKANGGEDLEISPTGAANAALIDPNQVDALRPLGVETSDPYPSTTGTSFGAGGKHNKSANNKSAAKGTPLGKAAAASAAATLSNVSASAGKTAADRNESSGSGSRGTLKDGAAGRGSGTPTKK